MIGTSVNEKQLAMVDGATALGQLADDALLAVIRWQMTGSLDEGEARVLGRFSAWLVGIRNLLADPLSSIAAGEPAGPLPGFSSFGSSLAGSALGLGTAGATTETNLAAVSELQATVRAVIDGKVDPSDVARLRVTFDAIARAMLSAADDLLAPTAKSTWATTSAF